MKIRTGFVSNSSSSSFVVVLPEEPQSAKDVERIFFPGGFKDPYTDDYEDDEDFKPVTAREIAEHMWKDIQEQRENRPLPKHRIQFALNEFTRIPYDGTVEDVVWHLGLTKKRRKELLEMDPDAAFDLLPDEIIEAARRYGASVRCFPPKNTTAVYAFCYGSGTDRVGGTLFNHFDFLGHLPFTVISDS